MPGLRSDLGKFRHRITFYDITRVDDGSGGFTRSDPSVATSLMTVWAHVETIRDREFIRGEAFEQGLTHRVHVRYDSRIEPGQTIVWNRLGETVELYVTTITNPDHTDSYLVLDCREGGPM